MRRPLPCLLGAVVGILGLLVAAAPASAGPNDAGGPGTTDAASETTADEDDETTDAASETADGDGEATAAATRVIDVDGRGWGHGRGMGQWGSLGYALGAAGDRPWTYGEILDHFYGDTAMGSIGNPEVRVLLQGASGGPVVVASPLGQLATNGDSGGQRYGALRVSRTGTRTFQLQHGPGCGGPWTEVGTWTAPATTDPGSQLRLEHPADLGTEQSLRVCSDASSSTPYRGRFLVYDHQSSLQLLNGVAMDSYLRGVVPRESPASWGEEGGGRGMEALKAQAVAARSYAAAGDSRWGPVATTCDTTFCQVYGGRDGEHPYTNDAIDLTSGQVRTRDGAIARTEFSASTGGHTAGGTFPPVPDLGDVVSPLHTWNSEHGVAGVEGRYGLGALLEVEVLERNGLGADGGRVLRLRLVFENGSRELTGNEFRRDLGLRSDWFTPDVTRPTPAARSITDACPDQDGSSRFSDVTPGSTHAIAIECVSDWQVALGKANGTFDPDGPVTRAQGVSFTARVIEEAGGTLPSSPDDAFHDDDGSVHEANIDALAELGIVGGKEPGRFEPSAVIQRAELASLLARAYVEVTNAPLPPSIDWFADDDTSAHDDNINRLAGVGVVSGYGGGEFGPTDPNPRDQMASFVARLLDLLVEDGRVTPPT